ncbi:MAG TPA: hypothetical protein VN612_13175 [Acidobacteriaceae bacterium]|nr:hypothetical protein [Acidobacteriaceae bacterium]
MTTRDELKSIIDQMPTEKFDLVRMNLESILHPPPPNPAFENVHRRSEELRKRMVERLKQLQAGNSCATISNFYGGGGGGGAVAEFAYGWVEDRARMRHRFVLHENHELDFVERLEVTEDGKALVFEQEIYAEGGSVKRKEEFPILKNLNDP